jgi:exopolysaccharide biosynthesis protein
VPAVPDSSGTIKAMLRRFSLTAFVLSSLGLFMIGAGCQKAQNVQTSASNASSALEAAPSSINLDLHLYRFDPKKFTLHVEEDRKGHTIREWMQRLPQAVFITNGFYFRADGSPAGLLITHGKDTSDRTFDWDKSALITFAPKIDIIETTGTPSDLSDILEAGQSYPLLIRDGKPVLTKESELTARRTFFGLDTNGDVYFGVISKLISLYELQHELLALPIHWKRVVNLDGGPSSGLWSMGSDSKNGELIDSQVFVPNVVVIEAK